MRGQGANRKGKAADVLRSAAKRAWARFIRPALTPLNRSFSPMLGEKAGMGGRLGTGHGSPPESANGLAVHETPRVDI